jgi:nitroreductase
MLSRNDVESYRRDGYLPGRRLLSPAEVERFRNDCLRTCAKPMELGDQNPYSLKRHASNRVKPYLLFPWAAELVRHARILDGVRVRRRRWSTWSAARSRRRSGPLPRRSCRERDMPEATPDLFEIIATTRSMRRLKPDPVPAELIRKILEAGTAAPSGGNMQRWRFLVVTDPEVKETVGAYYKRAWDESVYPRYSAGTPAPGTSPERFRRMLDAAQHLADHIHEAPVWIVPCLEGANPSRTAGSSIYPAVQNTLLAARALGLGATLTTLYLAFEREVEAALGLPADVHSYALLPIGYPIGRFGPVRRVPLAEVVYENRWGRPYSS